MEDANDVSSADETVRRGRGIFNATALKISVTTKHDEKACQMACLFAYVEGGAIFREYAEWRAG